MRNYLMFLNNFLEGIFQRIYRNTSIDLEFISLYRIFSGIIILLNFPPHFKWIGNLPKNLFIPYPFSVAKFFNGFPSTGFFTVFEILFYVGLFLIILGVRTRFFCFIIFIILIIQQSLGYSLGKIDHHIFQPIYFLILGFSNCGVKYAFFPDKYFKFGKFAPSLLALLIVFGFFTAGFPKAMHWIDFDTSTSGFLAWHFKDYFTLGRNQFLAPFIPLIPFSYYEIIDYITVLFELSGFLFLIYNRKFWHSYLLFACFFHLSVTLLLNIDFSFNSLVFGLWLLAPLLKTCKYYFLIIIMITPFYEGLEKAVIIWCVVIFIILFQKFRFSNRNNRNLISYSSRRNKFL